MIFLQMRIYLNLFFAHVLAKITTIMHKILVRATYANPAVIVSSPNKKNVIGARMISNPPTK